MIQEIGKLHEAWMNNVDTDIFDRIRVQHQRLVASVKRFMDIFGIVEFFIFLDGVVLISFVVYDLISLLSETNVDFDNITLFTLKGSLAAKTYPLLMMCIASDMAANQVCYSYDFKIDSCVTYKTTFFFDRKLPYLYCELHYFSLMKHL